MLLKNKIIFISLLVIISLFLMIYFIIYPTIKEINIIHEAITSEQKELQLKLEKGMLIKKINEDFGKIKNERERLYSIFIIPGHEVEFVEKLEKNVTSYNLDQKIRLLNFGGKTQKDEWKKNLTLSINLNGDFIQVINYLNNIEKLNEYFNINSINLEVNDAETGTVNASIEGDAYSLIEPES